MYYNCVSNQRKHLFSYLRFRWFWTVPGTPSTADVVLRRDVCAEYYITCQAVTGD